MLGDRLKGVREKLGLSQTEFAERCGVTMRSQRNYEKDERQPDAGYLMRIHQEFGVDITWLLTGMSSQLQVAETPAVYGSELKPDEAALLDNYRHSGKEGQTAIAQVALVAASAQPGTVKSRKKAG